MTPRHFLAVAALATLPLASRAADAIDFNRDVRPILADICFHCHGPDAEQRKADLRLDTAEGLASVLTAGKSGESEMYRRITAHDPKKRMPPAASGRKLSDQQIERIRRWIEGGANYQRHWALVAPKRPPVPQTKYPSRNPIDAFILARLEAAGRTLSPETDRTTLIRRVTLDLTGLPPTPAEVDAFLNDSSPNAYEKVVDRLLASPRYGERMAVRWLDAARYADTGGYQTDGDRTMWRWRDWVIDAYNANMPFDRFTIEQLAGDLLPNATLDQRIATGFNRNHRMNAEGGIIPEEYAAEYVVDRVDTTATVWLGLTLGCARCHDHKYDPFRQREYYQLFSYFNNIPENGRAIKYGNSPPMVASPTKDQKQQLATLDRELAAAEKRFRTLEPGIPRAQKEFEDRWEKLPAQEKQWSQTQTVFAYYPADHGSGRAGQQKPVKVIAGKLNLANSPCRCSNSAVLDGKSYLDAGNVGDFGFLDKFTVAAWVYADDVASGAVFSRMAETPESDGYGLHFVDGKLRFHLTKRWLDDALRVETKRRLPKGRWHHIAVTYDGTRLASGVRIYVDGRPEPLTVLLDELNQTFANKEPFRIGSGGGPTTRLRGRVDAIRIYDDTLSTDAVEIMAVPDSPGEIILNRPPEKRTTAQSAKVRTYFLETEAPREMHESYLAIVRLRKERQRLIESFPTTMVMRENPTPRDTFVLLRGQYDKKGEKVSCGVPAALAPPPSGVANNRLGLAAWLVSPDNPLTARVAVNRLWAMLFGTGIVKTVDDFGTQGEFPSHPELLDWLAVTYRDGGWDTKALLQSIVTSSTYRQSSRLPAVKTADPENRLLSHFPRARLSGEMIRDQALFASGLLVERQGGPSVKPYQPAGLGKDLGAETPYVQDTGTNLYRRSLYTYWKRTVAPPNMLTFDASGREACWVREARTNTPLQALTLLNDVTFVEASRKLAERAMREAATTEDRIIRMFRLATGRTPSAAELRILADGYRAHRDEYRANSLAARKLLAVGESPPAGAIDPANLAAFTAVAAVILNLDEAITKE